MNGLRDTLLSHQSLEGTFNTLIPLQALWTVDLAHHGAPASDSRIVCLTFNAEQETIFIGLDTGSLFCIQTEKDEYSSVEEVLYRPPRIGLPYSPPFTPRSPEELLAMSLPAGVHTNSSEEQLKDRAACSCVTL